MAYNTRTIFANTNFKVYEGEYEDFINDDTRLLHPSNNSYHHGMQLLCIRKILNPCLEATLL